MNATVLATETAVLAAAKQPEGANLNNQPALLTTKQTAQRFNVSTRTLTHWQRAGLPFLKIGPRKNLFRQADCEAWLVSRFEIRQSITTYRPRHSVAKSEASK